MPPRGKGLTEADKTAIRAGIAAGQTAADIGLALGRSAGVIKVWASKNKLRFTGHRPARRPAKPKPPPVAPPPAQATAPVKIPEKPVDQLHMLITEATRRGMSSTDNREFGYAVKAASDAAAAIHRLPVAEGGTDDDLGELDRSLET